MKNLKTLFVSGFIFIIVLSASPTVTNAQTVTGYQPQTKSELIAYLYGRIAQLLEIKKLLDSGKTMTQAANETEVNTVVIETHGAADVTENTAVLRGEVLLFGRATATAWFEYGQDPDFLDLRTNRAWVNNAYDRAIRIQAQNLEDDERYYYRIVTENNDKTVSYGDIHQFRTDEIEEEEM